MNLQFANGVVGHLTGSYDADPRHNLERCEVLGTKGRFVLDNLYEELTFYPRGGQELTVIRNSIMGGLSGFDATFTNRIHRWLEQVSAGVDRKELEASGREGLAVHTSTGNNTISGAIGSSNTPAVAKNGPGTWILSGNNAYSGTTTVSGGTLTLSGARTGSSGAITVSNIAATDATLNIQNGTHALGGNAFSVASAPTTPATGTVNQSGGTVTFTSGNGLLIGNRRHRQYRRLHPQWRQHHHVRHDQTRHHARCQRQRDRQTLPSVATAPSI